jgi:hypothetical protein
MAGSVNTAAQRTPSVNITITSRRSINLRLLRDGLNKSIGGGSFAPAVEYQKPHINADKNPDFIRVIRG